jgi:hypothetical protein
LSTHEQFHAVCNSATNWIKFWVFGLF